MIKENKLLEYAQYVGNYYGTPAEAVDKKLNEGFDVVLDIDTKGAAQVMERRTDAIGIFLFPGSYEILRQRLMLRSTESPRA
jgi:guanylate kinase